MSEKIFFFDTYAFFEIIRGSLAYDKYKDAVALTSIFNLAELNYGLKKKMDEKTANGYIDKYAHYLVEVDVLNVKDAMSFKLKHKKISIPDAIGYVLAKKHKAKFLTGDNHFKGMSNVEFVK